MLYIIAPSVCDNGYLVSFLIILVLYQSGSGNSSHCNYIKLFYTKTACDNKLDGGIPYGFYTTNLMLSNVYILSISYVIYL